MESPDMKPIDIQQPLPNCELFRGLEENEIVDVITQYSNKINFDF